MNVVFEVIALTVQLDPSSSFFLQSCNHVEVSSYDPKWVGSF